MVSKIIDNPYIFDITYKANSFDILINNINLWKKSKLNKTLYMSIKKIIIRELKYLNYNLSHIGTKYLIDTIIELYYSGETTLSQNLTKTVYPILSRKYNKSINNIKINITRATTNMYYNCPEERLQNFFGFSSVIEKPHSKEIIYIILNKLAS